MIFKNDVVVDIKNPYAPISISGTQGGSFFYFILIADATLSQSEAIFAVLPYQSECLK